MRKHLLLLFGASLVCPLALALQMKAHLLKGDVLNRALHGDLFSAKGPLPALLFYFFLSVSLAFLYSILRTQFAQCCTRSIRQAFFKSYLGRSYRQFCDLNEGDVIALYSQQIATLEFEFFVTLGLLAEMLVTLLFALVTLLTIHRFLGFIYALLLALPLLIPPLFRKIIEEASEAKLQISKRFTGGLTSYFKVFELIKNMQIEGRIGEDFNQANEELRRGELLLEIKKATGSSVSFLTSLLGQFGAMAVTAFLIYQGKLEAGSYISVTGITMACGAPLYWTAHYWQTLIASRAARRDILAFIADSKDAVILEDSEEILRWIPGKKGGQKKSVGGRGEASAPSLPPHVEYRKITFGYKPEQPLFQDVSLELQAGSHTLVTGPSGCGKSTLANLLLRQEEAQKGSIFVNGQDLQVYGDLSAFAAISRQEALLFSDSLRENLTLGRHDIQDEAIFELLKKVGLEKWAKPKTLDRNVEAQGENLSGGEKKRLSLLRALLRQTPLLILDEPLANIDPDNVEHIEKLIAELKGCTLLVVSHQGSEAFRASFDQVFEFKGGGNVELSAVP